MNIYILNSDKWKNIKFEINSPVFVTESNAKVLHQVFTYENKRTGGTVHAHLKLMFKIHVHVYTDSQKLEK